MELESHIRPQEYHRGNKPTEFAERGYSLPCLLAFFAALRGSDDGSLGNNDGIELMP